MLQNHAIVVTHYLKRSVNMWSVCMNEMKELSENLADCCVYTPRLSMHRLIHVPQSGRYPPRGVNKTVLRVWNTAVTERELEFAHGILKWCMPFFNKCLSHMVKSGFRHVNSSLTNRINELHFEDRGDLRFKETTRGNNITSLSRIISYNHYI